MFLDTASVRASVVSHAKTLGYTPNSARIPIGTINVTLNNVGGLVTATIPAETVFTATVDDVSYQFVTVAEHTSIYQMVFFPFLIFQSMREHTQRTDTQLTQKMLTRSLNLQVTEQTRQL